MYLWPRAPAALLGAMLWAITRRPLGFVRCVGLGLRLPVEHGPAWKTVLPLLVPTCVLAREATRRGIQHLHSHSCKNSAIFAMMLKRLTGLGYSLTLNADINWWGGAMAEKFAEADFTITHAQWLLAQIKRDFPNLRPDQALMGRIGVDTFKWAPNQKAGESSRNLRVITVGRLHPSKGHDDLLRAVARLIADGRDVKLVILGDGPHRQALESPTRQLRILESVRFEGSVSEDRVIEEMQNADIFVLASHAEALGVVYMEAMSMEVAVVGTAIGGVGEIITDGVNGLLVEPKNVESLAAAMARLHDDMELRRRLARAGRQTIVSRYDSRIGASILRERLERGSGGDR